MFTLVGRRIFAGLMVLFVVATATFFMLRAAPGGPFDDERNTRPEIQASLDRYYGLDQPLWRQYLDYLVNLGRGDLGPSFKYPGRSVNEIIAQSFPVSAELGLLALAVSIGCGVPIGVLTAARRGTARDRGSMAITTLGICVPTFVLGPVLILVFALDLGWVQPSGWFQPTDRILPALTLGAAGAAIFAKLTRAGMLEALDSGFVRTARAKGASESGILFRHALRVGVMAPVAYLGPAAAGLLTGSFAVETIFQIPGLGRFFVAAAFNRDYTLVLGLVLFYALLIVAFNLLVDLTQAWLNPKLRHG